MGEAPKCLVFNGRSPEKLGFYWAKPPRGTCEFFRTVWPSPVCLGGAPRRFAWVLRRERALCSTRLRRASTGSLRCGPGFCPTPGGCLRRARRARSHLVEGLPDLGELPLGPGRADCQAYGWDRVPPAPRERARATRRVGPASRGEHSDLSRVAGVSKWTAFRKTEAFRGFAQ